MIAVVGANGFVGSAIVRVLLSAGTPHIPVVRGDPFPEADLVVYAANPSRRLRAEQEPQWDFDETVAKTARYYYGHKGRFVLVSSVSARFPHNSVYGRHRRAAEDIVGDGLIIRLGPMYGRGLTKGILADMIADRPVYADPETQYAFADVDWCASRIVALAMTHRPAIVEVGGSNTIRVGDIPDLIGSKSSILPSDYLPREDQNFIAPDGPQPSLAIEWAKRERQKPPRLNTYG